MRNPWGWIALTGFSLLFFAFIYAPLLVIIGYSFNANPVNMMIWEGFTLDWYAGLFGLSDRATGVGNRAAYIESTDQMLAALRTSLTVAVFTTTISTVIGTATAIALARYRFRGRGFYNGFLMLPMMMPDIVLGIGLLIFFVTLGMQLSLVTIIIGHCTFLTSYVFIIVQARIAGLDPALEEASADLGASEWTTLRKVLLPQLAPGIMGGALLAFVISMDDLVITYFISGVGDTTLPVFIFGMIRRGVKPEINAIATLIILASVIIAALGLWLRSRKTD
ncbi:ABC transporter permease [Pseudotabrizicola alkalilacus]|uniref:Spermidine/putrescine transport system permease protein PotC n=1 Tax=Pseudotabrizicola alkalilacus TaxID=2305252 RepID=A0A411YY55_9RHOB|nr:ABC transporter permease [Pseudotabrizicola alkalilacus]RGP35732.1 ABC transporter permease [Pseudotabrizicola alkalilacus]